MVGIFLGNIMRYLILSTAILYSLTACQALPDLAERTPSIYIPTVYAPRLDKAFSLPKEPSAQIQTISMYSEEPIFESDVYILDNAHNAFAARAMLIDHADVSLDAQYYIWHNDVSGNLLMQKLLQAANRGVRVRLLLDDNNTRGMDDILAALDAHPNIEVRLFNPFLHRNWRALGYLTNFPRLNRRMHNKSFTADNHVSIIGGRNIGDEYFDVGDGTNFADMDVLVDGKIVTRISQEFDQYWRSDSAYPAAKILRHAKIKRGEEKLNKDYSQNPIYQAYLRDLQSAPIIQAAKQGKMAFIRAQTQLVSDDPAKALDRRVRVDVSAEIQAALGVPEHEIYLVSPYFVPTKTGLGILDNLKKQGVQATVFTNSLSATDVATVHSGYARYRKPMLQSGVLLYEFKESDKKHLSKDKGLTGSSVNSLHAKTFIVDKKRVFVGSFNLDPRSARLNTEMGLVIYHEGLAKSMQQQLQQSTDNNAYRVVLDDSGKLNWQDKTEPTAFKHEPKATLWKRFWVKTLSLLPIERLL